MDTRAKNSLKKRKIYTDSDVVKFFPRIYRDYRTVHSDITKCPTGEYCALRGRLMSLERRRGKRDYLVMKIMQPDGLVFRSMCFGMLYLEDSFCSLVDEDIVICGKIDFDPRFGYSITNPEHLVELTKFTKKFYPIYSKIKGVSDERMRSMIAERIDGATDPLPSGMTTFLGIEDRRSALCHLHYPTDDSHITSGKTRFLYEDMIYFADSLRKQDVSNSESRFVPVVHEKVMKFINSLPYELTPDQKNAVNNIVSRMRKGRQSNSLIQGDVGCGKTIVAAIIMINMAENGYQSVLMAPREVLAKQHFEEISSYASACGMKCVFLGGKMTQKEKKTALGAVSSGEADIVIGTHACISPGVKYKNLGLMVVDEEHLFGVEQKEAMEEYYKTGTHSVYMTATPIPRTLTSVLVSSSRQILSIKTMPNGRLPVQTAIQQTHTNAFPFLAREIAKGHQCYVVCPAIEENENSDIVSLEEMEKEYHRYFDKLGCSIGVLNGKMKAEKSEEVIRDFTEGRTSILLSTTVIEVGVNVPNATVIVIEQADRFGLASLHQLRGRVGRGSDQSYCILMNGSGEDNERLNEMKKTTDGFAIAEADLKLRSSGNLVGVHQRQSGRDKYVQEMLANPAAFNLAKKACEMYSGHYSGLIREYWEHEAAESTL